MDAKQWRFCKAIACDKLSGHDCQVEACEHPDTTESLKERRQELKAVKHG